MKNQFCVVGAGGYWGAKWVRVLHQLGVLSAVCDSNSARLRAVASAFDGGESPLLCYSNFEEMLANGRLDGIFIVTPPASHASLAIQALRAGKHVFVEKPLAETVLDCHQVRSESDRSGKIVMVGHTFVYHPAIRVFRENLLEIGRLKTIYTVRANFGLYQNSGIVRDLMPHDFSIFSFLCGGEPTDIRAQVSPVQDVAFVSAKFGDVSCSAFLSWSYPEKTRKLIAVGERGMLEWDLARPALMLHRKRAFKDENGFFVHEDEGSFTIPVKDESEPLMNEALHFISCINSGGQPLTGCVEGASVVKGLEACQ